MGVLVDKFKTDFSLKPTGQKGWYISAHKDAGLSCPFCHHTDGTRLAFIFSENACSFKCPKCGNTARLERYLWLIKRPEYISNIRQIKQQDILKKKTLIKQEENLKIESLETVSLPLFFKRLKYSPYLQSRGAKLELYKHWVIGKTDFESDLKDYIIFVIPENGVNVGWVARSQLSKQEVEDYNKTHKKKILRWRNSKSTDFGQIVFGLDEINEETEEVIIVEGITSKMRVDCELETWNNSKIKCCCTFGKKLSPIQLQKIRNKGDFKVILFYDSDAIRESKETVYKLKKEFSEVFVAFCDYKNEKGEYKDAGDLTKEELLNVLSKVQTPFEFFESKMQKKKLIR